jgi:hypothetical protein
MAFTDMRNFVNMLPEDKKQDIQADFDTLSTTVQGFNVGLKVQDRTPYSKISYVDNGAPFHFCINLCFDSDNGAQDKTDFHIDVDADLNFMMKMMLAGKIKEALDKIVDGIADVCDGKIPEGVDPSMFKDGFDPTKFAQGGNPAPEDGKDKA